MATSGLDVHAHNVETVERLTPGVRDRRAGYAQTMRVLEHAKAAGARITKTSIMLGLGERPEEIEQTLHDLRDVGCDVVTFGQYMRPTKVSLRTRSCCRAPLCAAPARDRERRSQDAVTRDACYQPRSGSAGARFSP